VRTIVIQSRWGRAALGLASTAAALTVAGVPACAASAAAAGRAGHHARNSWRVSTTISVPGRDVLLSGIDVTSADDAWADGEVLFDDSLIPLIEHWNGKKWSRAALPGRVTRRFDDTNLITAMGASSPGNVWVFTINDRYLRLSGTRWTTGMLPADVGGAIESATVFSPSDVWVFGARLSGGIGNLKVSPFAARFNGSSWKNVPVPGKGDVSDVNAVSANDIFAVTGLVNSAAGSAVTPTVLHWNGARWRPMPIQPRVSRADALASVVAESATSVWVGGTSYPRRGQGAELVLHWNGRSWKSVSPPAAPSSDDYLVLSMAPDGQGGLFAVSLGNSGAERLWHLTRHGWTAPVKPTWPLSSLTAVPRTTSTWALANTERRGSYIGLIIVHGRA
jgi:hypothetical protein